MLKGGITTKIQEIFELLRDIVVVVVFANGSGGYEIKLTFTDLGQ